MSEAERLNRVLAAEAPAAARCMSPLGRRSAFPRGIPYQSAQARKTEINASIGQLTDGHGNAMPLPAMANAVPGLDPKMTFLYSSQEGHPAVREAWGARQRRMSLGSTATSTTPMVVHGLTQAVSLCADLFADEDTDVVLPDPCWENYDLLFQLRPGATIHRYPFYKDGKFNVDGLADTLATVKRKAVIVINFPANPAGYMPTPAEAAAIIDVLVAHKGPAVVLFDDAYQGLVYEGGLAPRSLYWDLAERCDPDRMLAVKADGATKELLFFGGRIAFLSATVPSAAEDALLSKWKCIARSCVGVTAGPSQALVLAALRDPGLDAAFGERFAILKERYTTLKTALAALPAGGPLAPFPFNSGVFALVGVRRPIDAEQLRERLITEVSVGTISVPSVNALRIAFCSVDNKALPELVARIQRAVA